jgi:hypothetical protein
VNFTFGFGGVVPIGGFKRPVTPPLPICLDIVLAVAELFFQDSHSFIVAVHFNSPAR